MSIPTRFDSAEDVAGICFGYNAYYLPEAVLDRGLVLDVVAAKILNERGVDVGLKEIKDQIEPRVELFANGRRVKVWEVNGVYEILPADGAKVESEYVEFNDWTGKYYAGEEKRYPAAYSYENAKGQRFFVIAVDGKECGESVYRSYDKAKQFASAFEFVGRRSLPVKCFDNPDLYILLKEDEEKLYIGLWNLHADYVENAKIELSQRFKEAKIFSGTGTLDDNIVEIDKIESYSFVGIILIK